MQLLWMAISLPCLWQTTRASESPIQSSISFAYCVVHLCYCDNRPFGACARCEALSWPYRYVVLFFYPKDFTFVCPTEIIAFSDRSDEFNDLNCQVIGASTDTPEVTPAPCCL